MAADTSASNEPAIEPEAHTLLNTALEIDLDAARQIQASRSSTMITVLGAPESGKTGVLVGVFSRLKKGPFAGIAFSGSKTLKAFEKRRHNLTIESGRQAPTIDRTPSSEGIKFLHLEVLDTAANVKINLLLSDISGELCDNARNSTEDAREMLDGVDSDIYIFTVDGKKLCASIPERTAEIANVHQLFRRLLDCDLIGKNSRCIVAITKVDIILNNQQTHVNLKALENGVEARFGPFRPRVGSLDIFSIAASPEFETEKFKDGYEFKKMAAGWLTVGRPIVRGSSEVEYPPARSIDKLNKIPGIFSRDMPL